MAAKRHIPLSDNHRRAITTTLTLLDQRLCECEQIAHGREVRSVLYRESNDLSASQRKRLLHEIARARETMREIKDTLSLESEAESLSRHIRGASSSAWESLIETQSRRLRGYGKVPQALGDYLDPSLGDSSNAPSISGTSLSDTRTALLRMPTKGPRMPADAGKAKNLTPEERKENALRPCACLGHERDKPATYVLRRGMDGLAEVQLRRAIWPNPSEPAFKVHLAWCLYNQERYLEAHERPTQALEQEDEPHAREIVELTARAANPGKPHEKEEMP